MQVVTKYFVIMDHTCNKIDLCCDITSWTVCANDSIQGFALYTGTLPVFKCRYATLQRLKQSSGSLMFSFDSLTDITLGYEGANFLFHPMPTKLLMKILVHLVSTRVNGVQGIVAFH